MEWNDQILFWHFAHKLYWTYSIFWLFDFLCHWIINNAEWYFQSLKNIKWAKYGRWKNMFVCCGCYQLELLEFPWGLVKDWFFNPTKIVIYSPRNLNLFFFKFFFHILIFKSQKFNLWVFSLPKKRSTWTLVNLSPYSKRKY